MAGDPAAETYAREVIARLGATSDASRWPRRIALANIDLSVTLLVTDRLDEACDATMGAIATGSIVPANHWRAAEVVKAVEAKGLPEAVELREAYGGNEAGCQRRWISSGVVKPDESPDVTAGPWLMLIYRVPSDSSKARVAVWRDLKRLGGLYVQQAVCVLPDRPDLRASLGRLRERIDELGGSSIFLTLRDVEDDARERFVAGFREQSAKEYAEIIEECDTKFVKEIEFERFRKNYTFEEAEEIRQDLEKLRRWLERVEARDWIGADGRDWARTRVAECEVLLEQFEAEVYERTVNDPPMS